MEHSREVFVGIDVSKLRNAIAVADGERGGEVRYLGEVDASDVSMRRFIKKLAARHGRLHFCYEAGPTGYGLYRLITDLGHSCMGLSGIGKSTVSKLCKDIDERVGGFLERPRIGDWPYLWLDATYLKQREGGRIVSVAAIIAVAVNTDGS